MNISSSQSHKRLFFYQTLVWAVLVFALTACPLRAQETVSLTVNAGKTITTFAPISIFGINVASWADPRPVQKKVQANGNFLVRFPGGSWGDVYHWNSAGKYDSEGRWVPDNTTYKPGCTVPHYQPVYAACRTVDNDKTTAWRSNPDTDSPDFQWLQLDFGSKKTLDAVTIVWGNAADKVWPYAGKFSVQYWDPVSNRQWMPYCAPDDAWIDTTAKKLRGKGGTQGAKFTPITTQYLRLLMRESTAGKDGTYSLAEIKAYGAGKEVSPTTNAGAIASSTHAASKLEPKPLDFHFESFMEYVNSFTPKAIPLVIVNFGTGTPQEAAAWVHYANKVKGYGIKFWEIGNEMEGFWEGGGPANARDYARRFIAFYEAMKAEDPSITLIGTANGHESSSGLYDGQSYIQAFLNRLILVGKSNYLGGLSIHDYPQWGLKSQELLDSTPSRMASIAVTIASQLSKLPYPDKMPVWITEFNTSDHVIPDISVRLENGLWLTQYLCEFIRHFGNRGYATLWNVMNGGSAINDPKGADHGYLQAEAGPYQYQERADYWAMRLMACHWAMPGEARAHQFLDASSTQDRLAPYATLRPDGSLALLVVNRDPQTDFKASLNLQGFSPAAQASGWKFDSANYQWSLTSKPYHADPDKPPTPFTLNAAGASFTYTFPKYSLTVLKFDPATANTVPAK
jgi:hypothetical protein